ncbi:MAG: PqqD family protein [Dehalococcoidia bacterium]
MDTIRYRVNGPGVVAESLDGEVLIVNLESGCYYSADGTGEAIWSLFAAGHTAREVAEAVGARFDAPETMVSDEVARIRDEFVAEQLLLVDPAITAGANGTATADATKSPFAAPVLKKYTDMQELLLLDPIHDVDQAAGWPKARDD